MGKVNVEDDDGWVIVIDMKHVVVEAMAKFFVEGNFELLNAMCYPCVFPKYFYMAQDGSSFVLPDDDSRLKKKRKKRKRCNGRKKKQQPHVDRRQGLLHFLCIFGCILNRCESLTSFHLDVNNIEFVFFQRTNQP